MKTLQTMNRALLRCLETLTGLGLLLIALTVITQVVLSSAFHSTITGANELVTKLFVYTTAIGAAVSVGRDDHIDIAFARDQFGARGRRLLKQFALVAVGLLNVVILIYSLPWIRTTGDYLMPATQLPRVVAQLAVPVGSALAILFCVTRLFAADDLAQYRLPVTEAAAGTDDTDGVSS